MIELENLTVDIFAEEIIRELLISSGKEGTDAEVADMRAISKNPWDAILISEMLKIAKND